MNAGFVLGPFGSWPAIIPAALQADSISSHVRVRDVVHIDGARARDNSAAEGIAKSIGPNFRCPASLADKGIVGRCEVAGRFGGIDA